MSRRPSTGASFVHPDEPVIGVSIGGVARAYPTWLLNAHEIVNDRIGRPPLLEATPQAEAAFRDRKTLTIAGTLEYQACDHKICFNPVVVPLSWTVNVKRH